MHMRTSQPEVRCGWRKEVSPYLQGQAGPALLLAPKAPLSWGGYPCPSLPSPALTVPSQHPASSRALPWSVSMAPLDYMLL